jgi:hypothetical protein
MDRSSGLERLREEKRREESGEVVRDTTFGGARNYTSGFEGS